MWIEIATTAGLWLIEKLIRNDKKREEMKAKFYSYVDHWQTNRESSEGISEDVAWLNDKMNEDRDKNKSE